MRAVLESPQPKPRGWSIAPGVSRSAGAVILKERLRLGDRRGGRRVCTSIAERRARAHEERNYCQSDIEENKGQLVERGFESEHPRTGQKEVFPNKRPLRAAISD